MGRGVRTAMLALAIVAPAILAGSAAAAGPLVQAVHDGGVLSLEDGGRLRLAGLELAVEVAGAEGALSALEGLVLGQRIAAPGADAPVDRHGRIVVQAVREDGLWVQGELLRRGLARVRTRPDERERAGEMLAIEAEARAAGRGLWRDPARRILRATERAIPTDGFHLVEGRVLAADRVRDRIYLNFGPDWRTDFTASVETRDLRLFRAAGLDPAALAGRRVRLRGWLFLRGGPAMELTHPEQVELLP